ncbi:hypothetical protein DL764_005523 [Monosporascus ibericus]|uniref:Helicase ATP-binding domain-containing protein n=1 Tax=Monosporascus ibericus TaxID=155417 RepID=A0A4Q4TC71_9PEZI|nr:hypothetical protein DL764_005523 [Monosporascus ibericus]
MADQEAPGPRVQLKILKNHANFEPKCPPEAPDQEWRAMPELPTSEELNPDRTNKQQVDKLKSSLLPNTVEAPWKDKNTYLETHYRLQREESITMLRFSIWKFKDNPLMVDDEETCIYTKVFVQGYLMTRLGPMCRVRFSTERAGKRIRWNQTRRLITGGLVALSTATDRFRTICMPAVIADHQVRGGLDQNPPTIQLFWANVDAAVLDPMTELVMIETRFGYFESTRYTMVGLQHVAETDTPLDRHLVQADQSDLPADFVSKDPGMNLASLVHHVPNTAAMSRAEEERKLFQLKESLRHYHVLDGIEDRLSQYTNLDNSQLEAVHRILTKELSIIQGPPGTGKTFTSVQALRILLQSQERGSNVVVVAAQTNHAVDQILMQLTNLGFDIVRVGGRTQNEDMKYHSMYNMRRRAVRPSVQKGDRDFKTFEAARKKNISALQDIVKQVFPSDLLDPAQLLAAGVITHEQHTSLVSDDEWVNATELDSPEGVLVQWLGPSQLLKVSPHDYKDPTFEEAEEEQVDDVDAEDYNIELDDCVADNDTDRGIVRGTFVPVKHLWTGANPRNYSGNDLRIRREMNRPNLWTIDPSLRGAVYAAWQKRMLELHLVEFRKVLTDNKRITSNLKINRWFKDTQIIKGSQLEVIGCTTTGLTKYRGLLAALQPRTMLIEEAAETREANIISALYPSLQQLILVGDHQQLVPHCDTPGLSGPPYNIRVSLFERLVKLGMPFTMLNMQRRMLPSLRRVLNEFYPNLQDHPVVTRPGSRPPIPGMATESFLFEHKWCEAMDEDLSRYNTMEAEMIVGFVSYLLLNGVDVSQVTVLTFYRGQRKKILAEARKLRSPHPFTNVYTVDSYQGEENDIIILSLVRSNGGNGVPQAGFVADQNRGVVSISRARRGFYIFGNMANLLQASEESYQMWGKVYRAFKEQNRLGAQHGLPITCQQHGKTIFVSHPEQWVANHGGCDLPCDVKFECGHPCGRRCHQLRCGHACQEVCGQKCRCDCSEYTGAYPTDEFAEVSHDRAPTVGNYAIPSSCSGRAGFPGVPAGRDGGGRFSDRQPRQGNQGGITRPSYGNNNTRLVNSSAYSNGACNWATYNARQDDSLVRQQSPQPSGRRGTAVGTLIKLDEEPPTEPENGDVTVVRETFRPVTLTTRGQRTVGEGIVSSGSGTPSPDKLGTRHGGTNFPASHHSLTLVRGPSSAYGPGYRAASTHQNHMTGSESVHESRMSLPRLHGQQDNLPIEGEEETQGQGEYSRDQAFEPLTSSSFNHALADSPIPRSPAFHSQTPSPGPDFYDEYPVSEYGQSDEMYYDDSPSRQYDSGGTDNYGWDDDPGSTENNGEFHRLQTARDETAASQQGTSMRAHALAPLGRSRQTVGWMGACERNRGLIRQQAPRAHSHRDMAVYNRGLHLNSWYDENQDMEEANNVIAPMERDPNWPEQPQWELRKRAAAEALENERRAGPDLIEL